MHDAFMDPTGTRFSTLIYLRICNGVRKTCLQLINAFMDPLMQHHFHDFFVHMSSIYSFFNLYDVSLDGIFSAFSHFSNIGC